MKATFAGLDVHTQTLETAFGIQKSKVAEIVLYLQDTNGTKIHGLRLKKSHPHLL